MGAMVPRQCLCEDMLDAQTVEITSTASHSTDENNVANAKLAVIKKEDVHHNVPFGGRVHASKTSDGLESDDTDAPGRSQRSDAHDELSKAWEEAKYLKDMSHRLADMTDSRGAPLRKFEPYGAPYGKEVPPIHQHFQNLSIPENPSVIADPGSARLRSSPSENDPPSIQRESPSDPLHVRCHALQQQSSLQTIKAELAQTRQLLGFPAKELDQPVAAAIEDGQGGQYSAVPALSTTAAAPQHSNGPAEVSEVGGDFYKFRMHSEIVGAAAKADIGTGTRSPEEEEASQLRQREEQKIKLKEDLSALREKVRLAKESMMAGQVAATDGSDA